MDSDSSLSDIADQEYVKPSDRYFPFVGLDFDSGGEDDPHDDNASAFPEPANLLSGNSKKRRRSIGGNTSEESDEEYTPGKAAKRRTSVAQKKRASKARGKREKAQLQRPLTLRQTKREHMKEWTEAVKRDEELRETREAEWTEDREEQEKAAGWKEGQKVHLVDLPPELLDMIFSFDKGYSVQDYINLSGTCYFLRLPLQNDELWRAIYMLLGPPSQGKGILDKHPAYTLETRIGVGKRRGYFPTADTLPFYQNSAKTADYTYPNFHVEFMPARPEPDTPAERSLEVLERLNARKKQTFHVPRYSGNVYIRTTKMAIDAMNEETRIKLFAEIAWEMQHLPLSQAEVERDEDKILHGLLRPRCLSLTPWQVLTIRSVNFKMVSVKDCLVKQWLHIDEVNMFLQEPVKLPLTSKTPDVPYYRIKDYISRNQPILDDRKHRRHRVLLQRDARVPHWKEEEVEYAIPVCTRCGRYHDQDFKGCIYWWDAPDDPDYKPTYMGEPPAVAIPDNTDDSDEDEEEEQEDVKPVIDLIGVESDSDESMEN